MVIDATRPAPEGRQLVSAYGAGGFTVSGVVHRGSILILPDRTLPWSASANDQVSADSLFALQAAALPVELLIVGMGPGFALLPAALRSELKGWGIVAESMATPAACRTYNVLAMEGRRVAAALVAV